MSLKRDRSESPSRLSDRAVRKKRKQPNKKPSQLAFKSTAKKNGRSKVAEVMLAMHQPFSSNSNTSSAKTVAKHVKKLNEEYGSKYNFIIGHLVNEQLACQHNDHNFVPLTTKANGEHKDKIEKKLVNFLTKISGRDKSPYNRALDDKNQHFLAVKYRVKSSSDSWGTEVPDAYVPKQIEWEISFHVVNSSGSLVTNLSDTEEAIFNEFEQEGKRFFSLLRGTIKNKK